jgi:hypothetical protein
MGIRSGFSDFKNSVQFKELNLGAYLFSTDPAEYFEKSDPDLQH